MALEYVPNALEAGQVRSSQGPGTYALWEIAR